MSETIDVRNPRTGMIDYWITPPSPQQLIETCQNLRQAQKDWQQTEVEQRIATLQQWKQASLRRFFRKKLMLVKTEEKPDPWWY